MKFWVTMEGRDAEVEVEARGGRVWVEVEGRRIEADFCRLPDGEVYSLLVNGQSHEVRVSPAAGHLDVSILAQTMPVEVRHPLEKLLQQSRHAGGHSGTETVAAPMPGVVVALHVKPGDRVEAGQAVAVVEAMKMQNELATRHGGVVSDVLVAERASVAAGQPLLRVKSVEGTA